nr:FecR family protein [uncultured Methylophaga sp.]
MRPESQLLLEDEVLQQASQWFAILQSETVSAEEQQKWRDWLSLDPAHQLAWEQIEAIQAGFNQAANSSSSHYVLTRTTPKRVTAKTTSIFSIAILVIVSLITLSVFTLYPVTSDKTQYTTAIGETRQITLADGTQLWLNTNSQVETQFSVDLRQINLLQGEVFISSGSDTAYQHRPLVVDTEDGRLTALGTRFNVQYDNQKTTLSVFEGAVKTEPSHQTTSTITPAGKQTLFNQQTILKDTLPVDPIKEAWTKGILLANDMPLCEFIAEINRYQEPVIICPDELSSFRLMGSYPVNNIPRVLTAVETSLPVHIWQVNKKVWRIDKRH